MLRGLWSLHALWKGTAPARGLSPSVQGRGAVHQLRPTFCAVDFHVVRAGAPLRSLSLERRRSTRACRARARCRAGCGRFMNYIRPLHQREASLLCETVVRCARCFLPHSRDFEWRAHERATTFTVSWEEAQHASLPRARAAPRRLWSVITLHKATAPAIGLSLSVQYRGATCRLRSPAQSAFASHARERATALAVSGVEAKHASMARARAMLCWLWSVLTLHKATASARSLSPSVQGRGATCRLRPPAQPAFASHVCERATALAVYGEEAQHASLRRARAMQRWL